MLLSIDLPPWERDDPWEKDKIRTFQRFARKQQQVFLLREDSHCHGTYHKVTTILRGNSLDFLFLDGDHSYQGVSQDFSMYSRLVRSGGLVAFHDIHPHSQGWGGEVPKFWSRIKQTRTSLELVADKQQDGFGIGLLWV